MCIDFSLTVLGARGSMALSRSDSMRFGGATSCYMVQAGEQTVFLDAGSGLLSAPVDFPQPPVILLTHFHLDHVLGLGMYPRLSIKGSETRLILPNADASEGLRQLNGLYQPPYWPVSLEAYAGTLRVEAFSESLRLGDLIVDAIAGNHPGGCLVYRLRFRGKTIVFATDFEHDDAALARLAAFASGADLLMYDGQYTEAEAAQRIGFGHSTPQQGIALMERCGAKELLLIHHDPMHTDTMLEQLENDLGRVNVHFARAGEVLCL